MTLAAAVALAACAKDLRERDPVRPYSFVPVPAVPDRTAPVDAAWVGADGRIDAALVADGRYWATVSGWDDGERPFVSFDVGQALFGPRCVEVLGEDECMNDMGVVTEPTGELAADVGRMRTVSVVDERQRNYAIDGAELLRLVRGDPRGDAAPEDYVFVPFPFLLTVEGGVVVKAEQIWVP